MKRRSTQWIIIVALALLTLAPALVFSSGRGEKTSDQIDTQSSSAPTDTVDAQAMADATKNLATIQYSFREVTRKVLPTVVEVDVTEQTQVSQAQTPFDYFFNQTPGNRGGQPRQQEGLGSGIIVKRVGDLYYVLTNNHVVDSATTINVKLSDSTIYKAKPVGVDKNRDLAVISFTSKDDLRVADLGDSSELEVGDLVLAIGNPFGFENTVTMGIVSALGRSGPSRDVATNTDYIQTDAAINQGNSGGALVNIKGEVIGINTWIAAPTGTNIGLGFAIPINNAKKAVNDFISKGKVEYGWLGVSPNDPSSDVYYGVAKDLRIEGVKGALVLNVFKSSPADKAGMLPGDYITRVSGKDITNTNRLIQVVGDLLADKAYDFELIRYGEKMKLSLKLGVRPDDGSESLSYKNLWTGISVVHINDAARQHAQDPSMPQGVDGVMIGNVASGTTSQDQSPAAIAGFKVYDVISQINGKDIHNVMDFYKAINDKSKNTVSIKVSRQGTDVTIGLSR